MIYQTNSDKTARFSLGDLGQRNLIVFGVNPSTATNLVFDRTINRVKNYSQFHGFDGWLMLNLYPQRTTDPRGLHEEVDLALHEENMKSVVEVLKFVSDFTICAAWGNIIESREYLFTSLGIIIQILGGYQWYSIGSLTQEGHPRHPLYVKLETQLQEFAVIRYLEEYRK